MLNNQEIKAPHLIENIGYLYPNKNSKQKRLFGMFKCYCGTQFKAQIFSIKSGHTLSCGCLKGIEHHGLSNHKLYDIWINIKTRVNNKKCKEYKNYGGRGIAICDRWKDVSNFIEDMYPSYQEGLSIDRIDNNGNYEPSNCRWTTKTIQSRNTRILKSNNTSGYRGVSFHNATKKYIAIIRINGKSKTIGYFSSPLDGAKAYDNFVIENNLEHTKNGVL